MLSGGFATLNRPAKFGLSPETGDTIFRDLPVGSGALPCATTTACESACSCNRGLPAGHHLYLAVALSEAKPTEKWRSRRRFPSGNHLGARLMIPAGNISLYDSIRGFATLIRPAKFGLSPETGINPVHDDCSVVRVCGRTSMRPYSYAMTTEN